MKQNKINIFLLVTTILSTVVLLIGATFSYFSTKTMSKMNALAVEAGKFKLGLGVSSLYTDYKLIPTNDEDIMTAYENKCLDYNGYGACSTYEFEVFNFNKQIDVVGKIDFTVENIDNLSYMVLDENDEIYLDKTSVSDGISKNLSLGNHFVLEDANELGSTSKKFKLIIWLTNKDEAQDEYDAGGSFNATITFNSVYGDKLTASIEGYESELNTVSELGGE